MTSVASFALQLDGKWILWPYHFFIILGINLNSIISIKFLIFTVDFLLFPADSGGVVTIVEFSATCKPF